jgi:hypothetical protein
LAIALSLGVSILGVVYRYYKNCSATDNGGNRAAEARGKEQKGAVDNEVANEAIRQALLKPILEVGEIGDVKEICANARSFVELSQGNDTVEEVEPHLYADFYRDYEALRVWGEGFGNLEALRVLTIRLLFNRRRDNGDYNAAEHEVAESLYWKALAGALGRVQHNIELHLCGNSFDGTSFTNFVQVIRGVSTIRSFRCIITIFYELSKILMSTLASMTSLENVTLLACEILDDGEVPELTNLLKSPSLRSIEFAGMYFVSSLSRAMQAAFEEGSFVTKLQFAHCSMGEIDGSANEIAILRALVFRH